MRLVTEIAQLRAIAGGRVGRLRRDLARARATSRVAVLPRRLRRRAAAPRERPRRRSAIRGKRVPLVGRISMDIAIADVTDVPDVAVGDAVVLLGRASGGASITAAEYGDWAGLSEYEVTCGMSKRVPRTYVEARRERPTTSRRSPTTRRAADRRRQPSRRRRRRPTPPKPPSRGRRSAARCGPACKDAGAPVVRLPRHRRRPPDPGRPRARRGCRAGRSAAQNYLEAVEYIGFGSLPIVLLVGAFTGMVMSLQSVERVPRSSASSRSPAARPARRSSLELGAGADVADARRARRRRHRDRARHDAHHRADRRARVDGRQPAPVPRAAAADRAR